MYPSYMNKPAFMTNTGNTSFGASTSTFGQPSGNTSMFPSMQPANIFQTPNASSFNAGPTGQSSFARRINKPAKKQQPASEAPPVTGSPWRTNTYSVYTDPPAGPSGLQRKKSDVDSSLTVEEYLKLKARASDSSLSSGFDCTPSPKSSHIPIMFRIPNCQATLRSKSESPPLSPRASKNPELEKSSFQPNPPHMTSPTVNLVTRSKALNMLHKRGMDSPSHLKAKRARKNNPSDEATQHSLLSPQNTELDQLSPQPPPLIQFAQETQLQLSPQVTEQNQVTQNSQSSPFSPHAAQPLQFTAQNTPPLQFSSQACDPLQFTPENTQPLEFNSQACEPLQFTPQNTQPLEFNSQACEPLQFIPQNTQPLQFSFQACEPLQFTPQNTQPLHFSSQACEPLQFTPQNTQPLQCSSQAWEPLQSSPQNTQPLQFNSLACEPLQFTPQNTEPLQFSSQACESLQFSSQNTEPLQFSSQACEPLQFSSQNTQPLQFNSQACEQLQFTPQNTQPLQFSSQAWEPLQSSPQNTLPLQFNSHACEPLQFTPQNTEPLQFSSQACEQLQFTPQNTQPLQFSFQACDPLQCTSQNTQPLQFNSQACESLQFTPQNTQPLQFGYQACQPPQSTPQNTQPLQFSSQAWEPLQSNPQNTQPLQFSSQVMVPLQSTPQNTQPQQFSAEACESLQSTAQETQPLQFSAEACEPVQSTLQNTQPPQFSVEACEPLQYTPQKTQSTPQETQPQQFSSEACEPLQSTPQEIQPLQFSAEACEPLQSTPQETQPQQFSSEACEPLQSTPQETQPQQFSSEACESLQSTPQETQPQQFCSEACESLQSTPQETQPEEFSSEACESLQSTPQETQPQEFSSEACESLQSTPQETQPQEFCSEACEPLQSAPQETQPLQLSSEACEPLQSTQNTHPQQFSSQECKPLQSTLQNTQPLQFSSQACEPVQFIPNTQLQLSPRVTEQNQLTQNIQPHQIVPQATQNFQFTAQNIPSCPGSPQITPLPQTSSSSTQPSEFTAGFNTYVFPKPYTPQFPLSGQLQNFISAITKVKYMSSVKTSPRMKTLPPVKTFRPVKTFPSNIVPNIQFPPAEKRPSPMDCTPPPDFTLQVSDNNGFKFPEEPTNRSFEFSTEPIDALFKFSSHPQNTSFTTSHTPVKNSFNFCPLISPFSFPNNTVNNPFPNSSTPVNNFWNTSSLPMNTPFRIVGTPNKKNTFTLPNTASNFITKVPEFQFSNNPTNQFPSNTANQFPSNPANQFPSNPANQFPSNPANQFPSNPPNQFPSNPANQFPSNPANQFQNYPANQFPSNPANQFPSNPANQFPSNPPNQFPSNPANQFPSNPANQFQNYPTNQFPSNPANQFPSNPANQYLSVPGFQFSNMPTFQFSNSSANPGFHFGGEAMDVDDDASYQGFGTNLFGQQQQQASGGGLFGSSNAFGQNKTSFGFGSTPAQPGPFGQQPQQPTGPALFPSNPTNLFGSGAFGNQPTGTVIKFSPVTGTDTMQKNGVTQSISTKHHCITCMKEYEGKSLEELRFEDYSCNRKGPQQQSGFGSTPFGATAGGASGSLFGQPDNKQGFGQAQTFGQTPAFGQATPGFGVANQATAPTLFGKPNTFGVATSTTPSFGFNASAATSNPFSASQTQKPFSQPLFGASTTQAQPTFGTGVFGQTNTQNAAANLFQKPAQPATGFNTGQQGFSFNQPTTQASNLFQVSKPNTGFGIFGQTNTTPVFGQSTQPTFGTNFGKLTQPSFTQPTQPTFGTNLTGGLQPQQTLFGSAAAKPPTLFGGTATGGGLFNNNVFQQTTTPFSLNLNQHPTVQFPPEQPEDKSISYSVATDSFPDGPHVFGLEPLKGEIGASGSNPKDVKQIVVNTKKRDDALGARTKIKVQTPKAKRGNTYSKDFFKTNQALKNSPKCLIIKKFNDNSNTGPTIYNKYKNELLEEAEVCLKISSRATDSFRGTSLTADGGGGGDYNPLNSQRSIVTDRPEEFSERLSDYKARINKLKLHFDSFSDDSETKAIEEVATPRSDISSISGIESVSKQSADTDTGASKTPSIPLLDIVDEEPLSTPHDEEDDSYATPTAEPETCENVAGVILTKPEYYMYPALKDLGQYMDDNGECIVQGLTIGRRGYGNVYFPDPIDISNMNIDEIVHFRHRELVVYPDENTKPPMGEGLNRRAQVTLDKIYPRGKGTNGYITDVSQILNSSFVEKLMDVTLKHESKFVDYRPKTGSWVFKVQHFSKYGFTESDEEECEIGVEKTVSIKLPTTFLKKTEMEVDEVPMKGLGGSSQLLKNRLISKEADSFVMESNFLDMWNDVADTFADEMVSKDSTIQNIKSSIFTNLDFAPKESKQEPLIATRQRDICSKIVANPRIHKLPDISLMIQPEKFTTSQRCYKDFGVFRNNTYKIGWGPGLTFCNLDPAAVSVVTYNLNRCKINIDNPPQYDAMMPNLIDMLNGTFYESDFSFNNETPTLRIKRNLSYLQRQTKLFNEHAKKYALTGQETYLSNVWNLCSALWGPGDNSSFSRRQSLSNWLQKFAFNMSYEWCMKEHMNLPETEIFKTIFKLLSFYKVSDACEFALKNKMSRLAVLISLMSANERYKYWMQKYVDCYTWKEKDLILDEFKKIYLLLAGTPTHNAINICDGLDWMRTFGLHLWYVAPVAAPIDVAFNLYKKAFEEAEYASKPIPPYCDSEIQTTQYDLTYHVIGVYVDSTYQLCKVLHPETHTENLMDYRLSWFMLQLFLSLKAGLIRDSEKEYLHTTFSTQLESMGHWKWAIVVLLYLENNVLKKNLITKILDRNLSSLCDTGKIERELVQKFKVPAAWIHEVKATKTKAEDRYYDYFQHYIYLKDGHQANKTFMMQIGPELFVNEQYDYLEKFITKLQPFSTSLVNWQNEVGVFQDCLELHKMLSDCEQEPKKAGGKLSSILRRLTFFPLKTESQNLCVAELSRRCALIFKILNKHLEREEYFAQFVSLFRNLYLTPDIRHNEIFFLVTKFLNEDLTVTL